MLTFRGLHLIMAQLIPLPLFLLHCFIWHHKSMEEIGSACQEAWNGLPSKRPVMEMTIPSSLDKTISPPGIVKLFFLMPFSIHDVCNYFFNDFVFESCRYSKGMFFPKFLIIVNFLSLNTLSLFF